MANRVTIDENICKGCALCTVTCPRRILQLDANRLNIKGYHPAIMTDQDKCVACAMCAVICPDSAITVEKEV